MVNWIDLYAAGDSAVAVAARVQTGLDRAAVAADREQTGLDRAAVAADRVQTGLDRASATSSAGAAASSAAAAAASVVATADRLVGRRPSDTDIWSMLRATTAWGVDSTGDLVETPIDTLRWEYDPATLAPLGAAFQGAGSNRMLNPRFLGGTPGVIGSGGVLPTNVTMPGADAGITTTFVGAGIENGWPYAEFTLVGTAVGSAQRFACATGSETWVTGETLAVQGGFRLSGGTTAGLAACLLRVVNLTPTFTGTGLTISTARQFSRQIYTPTAGATSAILVQMQVGLVPGQAVNATVRLYAPMIARRPFCEGIILPAVATAGVSTRAQGTVSLPIAQLGTRFNRRAGILIVDWNSQPGPFSSTLDPDWFGLASWGDQTANERLGLLINPAHTSVEARVVAGGVAGTSSAVAITPPAAGVTTRAAVAWDLDAGFLQVASRGAAGSKVALTALPIQGFLMPGRFATSHGLFGRLQGFDVRPAALFDASLAALT